MHAGARSYVARFAGVYRFVVELGARNVNGAISDLFAADKYLGVDIEPGDGVDVVADAATWWPDEPADLVVCCEVLEHTPAAARIVANSAAMLAAGGRLIVTAATDPRAPHSAVHGGCELRHGEWYRNVAPDELEAWMTTVGLHDVHVEVDGAHGDVYGTGVK